MDNCKERKKYCLARFFKIMPLIIIFIVSAFLLEACAKEKAVGIVIASGQSCVSAECHPRMGKDKYVHGPVATGDCSFCHKQEKIDEHHFRQITDVAGLCYECHEPLDLGSAIHQPVKDGDCIGCHDPHQAANQFQLIESGAQLCYECHDNSIGKTKFVHGPVAVDGCSICHAPHSSDAPKLLMAEGNEMCYFCHTDKQEEIADKEHIHEPVEQGCVECHSPHGSDFNFSLPANSTETICFTCHAEKQEEIAKVTVKHGGLESERRCLGCHNPHASIFKNQLDLAPLDLCLSCHDRQFPSEKGSFLADMRKLLAENPVHHGPIADKDCSACHDTHGGNYFRILRTRYPRKFYASFDPDNFALCFMCHNNTLVEDAQTTTLTNFRNGDQNLHYVHVNKKPKGRTCRACHDAHATKNPKHVRDVVPFGAYKLPIGFTIGKNGGGCLPGCHQEFKYDRDKMVKNR